MAISPLPNSYSGKLRKKQVYSSFYFLLCLQTHKELFIKCIFLQIYCRTNEVGKIPKDELVGWNLWLYKFVLLVNKSHSDVFFHWCHLRNVSRCHMPSLLSGKAQATSGSEAGNKHCLPLNLPAKMSVHQDKQFSWDNHTAQGCMVNCLCDANSQ
jgi:hypothetical protein